MTTIDEITENFSLLDDWDDRYRYVIELGRALAELPAAARTDANKVQGCASQVWLATEVAPAGETGPAGRAAPPAGSRPRAPPGTTGTGRTASATT